MTAPALLLQITPTSAGGVPDFAEQLRRCWEKDGLHSTIFATDSASPPPSSLLDALAAEPAVAILLHLSSYGYATRGLCRWLARDLAHMLRSHPNIRLMTYFHETHASGPPWRSAFWTSREQRSIAIALGRLSETVSTNTTHHRDWLTSNLRSPADVRAMPVFSTVGEAEQGPVAPSRRPNAAVLFGSEAVRRQTFSNPALRAGLGALGIDRLVEIGSGDSAADGAFPVDFLGRAPASEVSEILSSTRYGLVSYPLEHVEKSTILAAYAAHGCVPVMTNSRREPSPILEHGKHYIRLGDAPATEQMLDRIGAEAYAWYQPHRLQVQAADLKTRLLSL
jgi:hypothetical protein